MQKMVKLDIIIIHYQMSNDDAMEYMFSDQIDFSNQEEPSYSHTYALALNNCKGML